MKTTMNTLGKTPMILERSHHEKEKVPEQYQREEKYPSDLETRKERKRYTVKPPIVDTPL